MEAAISSTMMHPNIVQTFTYIIKPTTSSSLIEWVAADSIHVLWLLGF